MVKYFFTGSLFIGPPCKNWFYAEPLYFLYYRGGLLGAIVADAGPTRLPMFTKTAAALPSCLPVDKKEMLIMAAYKCCVEIGLVTGIFDVELKMTPVGPKLIEINPRVGFFHGREWIKSKSRFWCSFVCRNLYSRSPYLVYSFIFPCCKFSTLFFYVFLNFPTNLVIAIVVNCCRRQQHQATP